MASFQRAGLTFDVVEGGPADGEPVLLLHGFPQHASSWDEVAPLLHAAGYRTLALQQRGYCATARPRGRRDYRVSELIADAAAAIDELAGGRAHVVGHDWGSVVAWVLAAEHPERVASLTAVSVPHVAPFLRSMVTSSQGLSSWYMLFFQLPVLPEEILRRKWSWFLCEYAGQSRDAAARDRRELADLEALRAALHWYRGMPFLDPRSAFRKVTVPTLFVWSDGDVAVKRASVDRCGDWVTGPYRLEVLPGVSHWIPDAAPERLAELVIEHVGPSVAAAAQAV